MAEDDALFQKGMPIRREVLGPEYVDASMARADEFMMSFQRATTAWAWGWAWGDPTLDRKTRSLMNLAMLTALNRAPEIKLHVKGALNNGVTVEEIKAALLHATAYCGIPAGLARKGGWGYAKSGGTTPCTAKLPDDSLPRRNVNAIAISASPALPKWRATP
jgi:4-carboxymuconolactone decarboxylase